MSQNFYTNVQLIGNQFLVRGVENGKRFETRDEFFPTLFVKSKKDSKYRTLSGEAVEPINPGTVRDCREFYKKYDELMDLKFMEMIDISINTFQKSIQKMK
jgi:hypothetical protein